MSDDVITLTDVSKVFRLPLDRSSTLKYRVTHLRSSSRYESLHALRNVSFSVPRGQFLGIVGHNGSGKSTLLKVLSRIYPPTTGSLHIAERVSPFLELGVGFNPELTARENVYLNGAVLGLTRAELHRRVESIIDFAGAEVRNQAGQKLKNFSSGMQVRLAFSVAIQAEAGILLMDEVLAVGDAEFQARCFDIFARYKREGRTVVLVTHDISAVENYCDRAILIDHGRVLEDGSASRIASDYRRRVSDAQDAEGERRDAGGRDPEGLLTDEAGNVQGSRWGSREVEITKVSLLDAQGKKHAVFSTAAPLVIEMEITAHEEVEEVVCGIAVYRNDGLHLTGSNSRIGGITVPCPPKDRKAVVRYEVPWMPLQAGSYLLSATCYDRHIQHPYDNIHQAFPFRVTQDGQTHGIVEFGGRWSTHALERGRKGAPAGGAHE